MAGEDKTGGTVYQFSPEALEAYVKALSGISGKDKDVTTTQTNIIQLSPAAAKQLLGSIAEQVQFVGKFSNEDIAAFVKAYNTAANAQLETVVRTAKDRIKAGKTKGDPEATITNIVTKEFPNFFDPKGFAEDFIWSKINFGKEKTLGAKSLEALQKTRSLVKDYGSYILSDIELQDAAKKLARGQITEGELKAQLAQAASIQYPELSEKLKAFPDATVRQLYSNKINLMSRVLELDPNEIQLDNPILERIKNLSIPDANRYLMTTPERDGTVEENEIARQAATSFARALGYGV